jgi:hypothetical protein
MREATFGCIVVGNILLIVTMVPAIAFAASRFGPVGAGYAWLTLHALYFVVWVPIVHRRLSPGLHLRWLLKDIVPIAVSSSLVALVLSLAIVWPTNRLATIALLALASAALLTAAIGASSVARMWVWTTLKSSAARRQAQPR